MTATSSSSTPQRTEPSAVDHQGAMQRVVDYFEQLSPEHLGSLSSVYAQGAHFKDPFNEVQGIEAIERIFSHMFDALHAPRFVVRERVLQGVQCFLTWEFRFRFKTYRTDTEQCILGASHLTFGEDGRVIHHRDYWDAAEELYEKLPVVGALMRWLKRRANR
jgi:steroid delta-isomerase